MRSQPAISLWYNANSFGGLSLRTLFTVLVTVCLAISNAAEIGSSALIMNCVNGSHLENPEGYVDKITGEWAKEPELGGVILKNFEESRELALTFFRGNFDSAIRGRKIGLIGQQRVVRTFHDSIPKKQSCVVYRGILKDHPQIAP